MGFVRIIACFVCPPLAVLDKGVVAIIAVISLTWYGWFFGAFAALLVCSLKN